MHRMTPHQREPRPIICRAVLGAAWASAVFVAAAIQAADPPPAAPPARLLDQAPHDQLIVRSDPQTVLDIVPLEFRTLPTQPAPGEEFVVALLSDPSTRYRVAWRDVKEIRFYEPRLLAEAERLTVARDFDQAYEYLARLRRDYPQTAGLQTALENYLRAEAEHWLASGRADLALVAVQELAVQNAKHPDLERLLGQAIDQVAADAAAREAFDTVRGYRRLLVSYFPAHAVVARIDALIDQRLQASLQAGEQAFDAGDLVRAQALARQALGARLDSQPAAALLDRARRAYPFVAVAVEEPATQVAFRRPDHAPSRRAGSLLHVPLAQQVALTSAGGTYRSGWGTLAVDDSLTTLAFQLDGSHSASSGSPPRSFDLVARLAALGAPGGAIGSDPLWRRWCRSIEVTTTGEVVARGVRPHLVPAAILGIGPVPRSTASPPSTPPVVAARVATPAPPPPFGAVADENNRLRLVRSGAAALGPNDPRLREVIEQVEPSAEAALAAWRRGDVAVVERLAPWLVPRLTDAERRGVVRYPVCTVHWLVPHPDRPWTSQPEFRRALAYALDRGVILRETLLRGQSVAGCQVLGGPWGPGWGLDDPLRYAYDERLAPRAFEPRLATALVGAMAVRAALVKPASAASAGQPTTPPSPAEVQAAAPGPAQPMEPPAPRLVLLHPPTEVARLASERMAAYWAALRIEVELRSWPLGSPPPWDAEYDLLYVELELTEPLIDAERMFGPAGLVRHRNPYLAQAVRRLGEAGDWPTVRQRLLDVNRLVHDDALVLPMWQLAEQALVHSGVQGVRPGPSGLYQELDQWRATGWPPGGPP